MLDMPHILVVDDTPEHIGSLIQTLRSQRWRVSIATNAAQGLQRAEAMAPDLVLLDVRMPEVDGFVFLRLMQEVPQLRQIPILFLTSANTVEERLEGLSHGGVDYILKNCEPAELVARVRIHLRLAPRAMPAVSDDGIRVTPDDVVLRAAMRLMRRRLSEEFTLEQIARDVGTYDKRLSALFRQRMGTTVFAWLREERLQESKRLLADTSLGMQDIAEGIGFRSACNFTTAFRTRMGVTPSQYRKAVQEGEGVDVAVDHVG
ncbi:response regulator [Luteibacter sp. Sphag1AF]|uniref:response regulator transcription factor n=1 Tax=Luteibacter sp. Sphag1AF TaxID=2587031 RepID=UPI0031B8633E